MGEGSELDEALRAIEEEMTEPGRAVLRESLRSNDMDVLRAFAGLCEAYVAQQREISAGYSRRRS